MNKNILKSIGILALFVLFSSCSKKTEPSLVFFPDMYYPVAYDPLMKAKDPYAKHENEVPVFVSKNGATALSSVEGTVSRNKDGILPSEAPKNTTDYNRLYNDSKKVVLYPMNYTDMDRDLDRGKKLYNQVCVACHGVEGDGNGHIVESGAYSGVPNYADRDLTIGSVHFVLEYGRNNMGSYAGQLSEGDRWRVALYVMHEFKKQTIANISATNNYARVK